MSIETAVLHEDKKLAAAEYKSAVKPIWCPGCGDFGVLASFYNALSELRIDPARAVVASGIGCSGRFPAFVEAYGFHGVHGRVLPLATGIKMGNPDLVVCAVGGDGDAFSIGAGHLPHAARRNVDITYIVMDNEIYGLTKGQPSPTSPLGMERKASPYGSIESPINPILMTLAYDASFVARGFSSRPKEVTELIKQGITHKGFAFIQIYSPCVTFYDTYKHFREVTAPLPANHDPTDKLAAIRLAMSEESLYLGVFYKKERPALDELVTSKRQIAGDSFSLEKLVNSYRS
ncbi:MAG: 2-oxoacid:ferredoxin oxidoreductase subunit beta [Anaerolineae bacterium]|nr:2-oxoacid:ferredoxin oxidoreductase subunit beta [Anaerolineae bacterium]